MGLGAAVIGLGGAIGSGLLNYFGQKDANEKNLAYQREANAKNEALMRESWAREDNAVQRRTRDLKAAGINPILAAGQAAASGGPIQVQAAEKKAERFDFDAMQAAMLNANYDHTVAATNAANTQAAVGQATIQGAEQQMEFNKERFELEKKKVASEIGNINAQTWRTREEANYTKKYMEEWKKTGFDPKQDSGIIGNINKLYRAVTGDSDTAKQLTKEARYYDKKLGLTNNPSKPTKGGK